MKKKAELQNPATLITKETSCVEVISLSLLKSGLNEKNPPQIPSVKNK